MATYGLIADVGGTNIRLALVEAASGKISDVKKYLCGDYAGIVDVITLYLQDVAKPVRHGCIAIACPTDSDWINMTNHSWAFSVRETQAALGFDAFHVINDYTAISMSIPALDDTQKVKVGGGEAVEGKPVAVYGPGTGLGVAHLVKHGGEWLSLPGEGGHVDFAPIDAIDSHILACLNKQYPHVSVEQLLSGPGLVQIYQALADYKGTAADDLSPADITEFGLQGKCEVCEATLVQFCRIMGSFGGNLALNLATFGGVYIAGGIVPRLLEFFQNSEFRARFEAKGRFEGFVARVPTYVITESDPGLIGAATYLRQTMGVSV